MQQMALKIVTYRSVLLFFLQNAITHAYSHL